MNEFDDNFNKIVVQFRSIFSKDNDDGDYQWKYLLYQTRRACF
jgi:hypothetical protein